MNTPVTKRDFIKTTGCALAVSLSKPLCSMAQSGKLHAGFPIIDLHQHINYSGRSELQLRTHQKAMGVHRTVLLPAGKYYGLAAKCGGNETVYRMAQLYPDKVEPCDKRSHSLRIWPQVRSIFLRVTELFDEHPSPSDEFAIAIHYAQNS